MAEQTLVLLDIDNTLIHALSPKEMAAKDQAIIERARSSLRVIEMKDYYTVFERANLDEFLDFLFKTSRVGVWTAASKEYAIFIIENCILKNKPNRKLEYFFCSHHCKMSKRAYKGVSKHINMLSDKWRLESAKNVILVDDLEELASAQANNKVITVKPFFVDNSNALGDKELLRVKKIIQRK